MCFTGYCIHFTLNVKLGLLNEILFSFLIFFFCKWELKYMYIMSPHCFKCTLVVIMFNYEYTELFYLQLRNVSFHMEETDKHDTQAADVVQVSQEDYQPSKSYFNQYTVLSTASATFPVPATNSTYCSYDYNILQNIKCEHNPQENILEDNTVSQTSPSVYDGVISGLQSVKCEQGGIIPFMNTAQASAWACDENDLTEVKLEKKTDPDEYDRNSDETRHWVVCQGGVLKEVKEEHALGVSEILPDEVYDHNVDQTQHTSSINHAKLECGSQLTVQERTHTGVEPYSCKMCARSFAHFSALSVHERTCPAVNSFTCHTCGQLFVNSAVLGVHQRTHTPFACGTCGKSFVDSWGLNVHRRTHTVHTVVKHFTCETCGKSFRQSGVLKVHEITHTGVKPYSCETCGKSFTQSGSLKSKCMNKCTRVRNLSLVKNHSPGPLNSKCMKERTRV